MSATSNAENDLSQASTQDTGSYAGLHALVPILLGLFAPCLLFMIIDPAALKDYRIWVFLILVAVLVSAGGLFILTLLNPGSTISAKFDPLSRRVELVRAGLFANTVYTVPFGRIVEVRMETAYDDDGYKSAVPVLVLTPHEEIELPRHIGKSEIAAIRAVLNMD